MRESGAVALVAVLMAATPAAAFDAAEGLRLAQVGSGVPSRQPAEPRLDVPAEFENRVADFVQRFYLTGERLPDEELAQLYAPQVAYFGGRVWSRERILADKRAYFARWPSRSFELLRETLRVSPRPDAAKVYDVRFDYVFDHASRSRTSRGRGRAILTIDLSGEGRIVRESGSVLERW